MKLVIEYDVPYSPQTSFYTLKTEVAQYPVTLCSTDCNVYLPEGLCTGRCKVLPIMCHEGPEGEWRYSFTLSLTFAPDGGGVQRHAPTALSLGKRPGTHFAGNWVGLRAVLNGFRSPDRVARSESIYRLSYPGNNRSAWNIGTNDFCHYQLTACNSDFSLPCSQKPTTCPCTEPDESSPHPHILFMSCQL